MPRPSQKQCLVSEISSTITAELTASLVEPAILNNKADYDSLHDLLLYSNIIEHSRYLNTRLNRSVGYLQINTITEFLIYPEEGFLANFRLRTFE